MGSSIFSIDKTSLSSPKSSRMFRVLLLIFFATFAYGQSEFDGKCPPTSDIDPFNWKDFTGNLWHEISRTDKSHELECAHIEYKEMGDKYIVFYEGELNEVEVEWNDTATVTGKSSYTMSNRVQTVVVFKKDSYAVVHECVNVGETKKRTYTWILSAKYDLSASEKTEIETAVKAKGLDKEIKLADLSDSSHPEECEH